MTQKEVKAAILRQLSTIHKEEIIHRSHINDKCLYVQDEARPDRLRQLHFYVESQAKNNGGNRFQQKQQIIQKINDLKGMTRFRYQADQTDYIVVDSEFFGHTTLDQFSFNALSNQNQSASLGTDWSSSEYVLKTELNNFLNIESNKILQEANRLTFPNGFSTKTQMSDNDHDTSQRFSSSDNHFSQSNPEAAYSQKIFQSTSKRSRELVQTQTPHYNSSKGFNKYLRISSTNTRINGRNGLQSQSNLSNSMRQVEQKETAKFLENIQNLIRSHIGTNYMKFIRQNLNLNFENINSPKFNRVFIKSKIIDVNDLDSALEFMLSKTAQWHQRRQFSLHQDYIKVNYDRSQHFVLSRVDLKHDPNNKSISRLQKMMAILPEHEKQVYHDFPLIDSTVREYEEKEKKKIIPEGYHSQFDIHQLVFDGPKGMDPCMSFNQRVYGYQKKDAIEAMYKKRNNRETLLNGSMTEGIQREFKVVEVPKPQTYHTYCQICMINYEDFDAHVASKEHITRAKNQVQIPQIDELIDSLNEEKRWLSSSWIAEPKKDPRKPPPVMRFYISKENKITPIRQPDNNVASRGHVMRAQAAGRKSGRVSVAGVPIGKQSRTSTRIRDSAKSSVARIIVVPEQADGKASVSSKRNFTPNKRSLNMVKPSQGGGWSSRKNYMLKAIAKDDEAQKSLSKTFNLNTPSQKEVIHIPSDKNLSSARFAQQIESKLSSKNNDSSVIAISPGKKPCTPYRIESQEDENQEMENEEIDDKEIENQSDESNSQMEQDHEEAEQEDQYEESYEDEEEENNQMSEDNEVTWDRNAGDYETIIKNMHQTEAPKKIEEMVRQETTEEEEQLQNDSNSSESKKEEQEPFTVEMDSTEKAFEEEVEQDPQNDIAEQLRPYLEENQIVEEAAEDEDEEQNEEFTQNLTQELKDTQSVSIKEIQNKSVSADQDEEVFEDPNKQNNLGGKKLISEKTEMEQKIEELTRQIQKIKQERLDLQKNNDLPETKEISVEKQKKKRHTQNNTEEQEETYTNPLMKKDSSIDFQNIFETPKINVDQFMHQMDQDLLISHIQKVESTQKENWANEEQQSKEFFDGTWSLPNESPPKGTIEKEPVELSSQYDVNEIEKFMAQETESLKDTPQESVVENKPVQQFTTPLFKDDNNISIDSSSKTENEINPMKSIKPSNFDLEQQTTEVKNVQPGSNLREKCTKELSSSAVQYQIVSNQTSLREQKIQPQTSSALTANIHNDQHESLPTTVSYINSHSHLQVPEKKKLNRLKRAPEPEIQNRSIDYELKPQYMGKNSPKILGQAGQSHSHYISNTQVVNSRQVNYSKNKIFMQTSQQSHWKQYQGGSAYNLAQNRKTVSPTSQVENNQQAKQLAKTNVQNLFDVKQKNSRRLHNGKQMQRSGLGSSIQTLKIKNKNYQQNVKATAKDPTIDSQHESYKNNQVHFGNHTYKVTYGNYQKKRSFDQMNLSQPTAHHYSVIYDKRQKKGE